MIGSANDSSIEIIRQSNATRRSRRALTLLEMVIALAIMSVVFAAGLTVVALGGIVFSAKRRGVGMSRVGWTALSLLCMVYVVAALFLVH